MIYMLKSCKLHNLFLNYHKMQCSNTYSHAIFTEDHEDIRAEYSKHSFKNMTFKMDEIFILDSRITVPLLTKVHSNFWSHWPSKLGEINMKYGCIRMSLHIPYSVVDLYRFYDWPKFHICYPRIEDKYFHMVMHVWNNAWDSEPVKLWIYPQVEDKKYPLICKAC